MMHKYFSSQHSPFHNDIHEAPRSSSPFIIYLLYFTLLWPALRGFSRSTGPEHNKALTPPLLEPAPVPPALRAKSSKALAQREQDPVDGGRMDCDQLNTLKTDPATEGTECPKDDTSPSTLNLRMGQPRGKCSSPALPNSWLSPGITFPCCLV